MFETRLRLRFKARFIVRLLEKLMATEINFKGSAVTMSKQMALQKKKFNIHPAADTPQHIARLSLGIYDISSL